MLTRSWQGASGNSGNCFEARLASDPDTGEDAVEVRNSTQPDGTVVRYTRSEWRAAVRAFKRGMFDLEDRAGPVAPSRVKRSRGDAPGTGP